MTDSIGDLEDTPFFNTQPKKSWMNGEVIDWMDATIHLDSIFREGDTVFEGIRAYSESGKDQVNVWLLDQHLKRFYESMKIRRMELPYSYNEVKTAIIEMIKLNEFRRDVYIQPWAFRTFKHPYYTRERDMGCWIWVRPRGRFWGKRQIIGITAGISSWSRIPDSVSPPRAKVFGGYIGGWLADTEVRNLGFDNAILLTQEGKLCEGFGENTFIVRDGNVITPSITQGILEGCTRAFVLEAARDLGYQTSERVVDRSELTIAEEAFFCGTGGEIVPIIEVDKYAIGDGKRGPITEKIQNTYYDTVRGKVPEYRKYLTPVY